jgi:hypothetical protein
VFLALCAAALVTSVLQSTGAENEKPPDIQQTGPGLFQLGPIRIDRPKDTVSFPATVNLTNVVIEYAVVTQLGKAHESLFLTEVDPYQLHVAMLLLGVTNQLRTVQSPSFPPGEPIQISVSWMAGRKEVRLRLEDLILRGEGGKVMEPGPWIYNGSRSVDGVFGAQSDGSIVSVIEDTVALVNNPRPGRDDDDLWFPNSKRVPPVKSAVWIHLHRVKLPAPTGR